ncbi:unnamed protein product [Kuraishia capsulata CBS 1993]|uniref:Methyltransferase domain-containing protein n=1 Tax=Kuraishia capsulata CBS 1993 TaxID=1382522 RepID=W6MIB2_9ASCO|nr:uncharacterized protein KUCA_T00002155001 [Kuraishia capsulata CBS 1993]CDK26184.1 unnamed protein product [Kuraishia capsulata CBS 1993]
MSAFSSKTFKTDVYGFFRPHYPPQLFTALQDYHKGDHKLAIDSGCGPGEASFPLLRQLKFNKVIGTDLSQVMVEKATRTRKPEEIDSISFARCGASDLASVGVENESVDLMTAAQCVHWFDTDTWFDEVLRVLKPGGTLAYWCYVDPYFLGAPEANKVYENFTYGDKFLGPFWEQPGRSKIRGLYRDVNEAISKKKGFCDVQVVEFDPMHSTSQTALSLRKTVTLENYLGYASTWSSHHKWTEANPGVKPDILDVFAKELQTKVGWRLDTEIEIAWKTMYCFARKVVK